MESPKVYMMLGLPGSGKTTKSKEVAESQGLERYSLDEEYFKIAGNQQDEHWDTEIEKLAKQKINREIAEKLEHGESVVLDFCPWRKVEREEYLTWLRKYGAEPQIYYFDVPKDELIRRFEARNKQGDANHQYMTPEMLDDFYKRFDLPESGEVVVVDK